jgi:hypothetical protein
MNQALPIITNQQQSFTLLKILVDFGILELFLELFQQASAINFMITLPKTDTNGMVKRKTV